MLAFVYVALPARVVFGRGTLSWLGAEIQSLRCKRAMVLSTPQQAAHAAQLAARLGDQASGLFAEATMHTPVNVTERACAAFRERDADCTVALAGGSTIGLGKAIALRTGCRQIAVPTTYAGSEATPILGQTEGGRKTTIRNADLLPGVILYDVDLTLDLPVALSVTSGINEIAHAIEALYAEHANPVTSSLAEQGISALARALPYIAKYPANADARSDALFGAWASGTCLGAVGMGLHHKLCHVLGGTFDLPHAETHAVILPHAVRYNAPGALGAMARAAAALDADDAAQALFDLARDLGAPTSLREIGMAHEALPRAVEIAMAEPYWNPRPLVREEIAALLNDAWHGRRPATQEPT